MVITNKRTDEKESVPCGKCPMCLSRRISAWSFRLMQEDKKSDSSFFLTLTYDTDHVPLTDRGYMGLSKRDVQLFFKKLRKAHSKSEPNGQPIKYYACGEYGGKTYRPHYHAIIFNIKLELMFDKQARILLHMSQYDGQSQVTCKQWDKGLVTVGMVSHASVGYTLKYMCKEKRIPLHRNDDRLPEFPLMSKKLGANYIDAAMIKWHKADLLNRMYINIDGGKKAAMPRYYKNKIYTDDERSIIAGFQKGKIEMETIKSISEYTGNSSYAWEKRQAVIAAKRQMYTKNAQRQKVND